MAGLHDPLRGRQRITGSADWFAYWFALRAGSAPCIAQGGEPPQGVAAIDPIVHQEAFEEGVHLRSPGPGETGKRASEGPCSVRSAKRIVRSIAEMFYGFTNFRVHMFDIR